jgi:hypothetical protein
MKLRKSTLPADLFAEGSTAKSDKRAARISMVALIGVTALSTVGQLLPRKVMDKNENFLTLVFGLCYLVFISTLVYTGVRMVGRSAGVTGFWRSLGLTVWRSFLYLILPSIVLTGLLLLAFGVAR